MRVMQVMPIINIGGAQTMCENLCNELKKMDSGIQIEIISFYNVKSEITERLEKNGFKIHYLNKHKGPDIKMLLKLISVIKNFNPDVIHTHLYALEYVIPALKFYNNKKVKLIHTLHSVASKENSNRIIRLQKKLFKKGRVIPVSISEEVKKSAIDVYGIDENSIPVVYNGVPLEKCIKKENYKLKRSILHIGRFVDVKNHELLINVFNSVQRNYNGDLSLKLVGEGPLEDKIKKLVFSLGIEDKVQFFGAQADCYSFFSDSDIFVLTSKYEGMPMTVIEAMNSGLPCVVNNVGGLKDMINDGYDGLLCNNEKELYDNIIEILENDKKREFLGKNAIKSAKKYSSSMMANSYINLYRN